MPLAASALEASTPCWPWTAAQPLGELLLVVVRARAGTREDSELAAPPPRRSTCLASAPGGGDPARLRPSSSRSPCKQFARRDAACPRATLGLLLDRCRDKPRAACRSPSSSSSEAKAKKIASPRQPPENSSSTRRATLATCCTSARRRSKGSHAASLFCHRRSASRPTFGRGYENCSESGSESDGASYSLAAPPVLQAPGQQDPPAGPAHDMQLEATAAWA